jgi:N-acetylated-alpha-linked acidic dipeptidase
MKSGRNNPGNSSRRKARLQAFTWLALLVAGVVAVLPAREFGGIRGFFPARAVKQMELEKSFQQSPTPDRARLDVWALTSEPHVAGTPEDYRTAQFVLEQFRLAGLEAEIAEYEVLLPMPREVKVDLVAPVERRGPTPEGGWNPEGKPADARAIMAFNAYSPSGDVTAEVVYANYGVPEDYDELRDMGIDVAGKIVLVRYGKCFRGVKTYVAERHGAAGVLIFSDPADDGYRQGDPYPKGPWRPATGVQRGSILYLTEYAGDPLTPGAAATKSAKRLAMKDAPTLPRIPTTPISYEDATPILENLSGPVAPNSWQGALPFTYHVGPGTSKVHLKLDMDFRTRPIWNVIARIPGATLPNEWVVLGNHRDAWVYGAVDAVSGTAPLLAVGRGLGQLLKQGWKPQRTIILGSWDAEEYGLIGSTEWVEDHIDDLSQKAVAYLNMDSGVAGTHFGASAVPSLGRLIREVADDVKDPGTGRSVLAVWAAEGAKIRRGNGIPYAVLNTTLPDQQPGARVGSLGSGSDYTPFLQHGGIPALDVSFGGPYGVYHSLYDSFDWMQKFGDPQFTYSVAAAQIYGLIALRLSDADLLPYDFADYADALQSHIEELEKELKQEPRVNFEAVHASLAGFTQSAKTLQAELARATARDSLAPRQAEETNRALIDVERAFLIERGLPGRPWFRHAFYAPGVFTGYSAVIFPGVREAAGRKDWVAASRELNQVCDAIDRGTRVLNRAIAALTGAEKKR